MEIYIYTLIKENPLKFKSEKWEHLSNARKTTTKKCELYQYEYKKDFLNIKSENPLAETRKISTVGHRSPPFLNFVYYYLRFLQYLGSSLEILAGDLACGKLYIYTCK